MKCCCPLHTPTCRPWKERIYNFPSPTSQKLKNMEAAEAKVPRPVQHTAPEGSANITFTQCRCASNPFQKCSWYLTFYEFLPLHTCLMLVLLLSVYCSVSFRTVDFFPFYSTVLLCLSATSHILPLLPMSFLLSVILIPFSFYFLFITFHSFNNL